MQPAVLGLDVVDPEGRERDAIGDQGLLEWARRGVAVRLEQQFRAIWILWRVTVSQRASPIGMSCFFTKPRTPV